ncbi:MAG: YbaN family protein [Planctomycetota bacterium]|nr:YbaN family protein [Planctomycetota bacterium]
MRDKPVDPALPTQEPIAPEARPQIGALKRWLLLGVGMLALGLGILGVILPLLPTTPLILAASACFAGASPTLHARLARSRVFGPMIQSRPGGRTLPRRTKIGVIGFIWTSIGATALFVVSNPWIRVSLAAIALTVTIVLVRIPSTPAEPRSEP